MKTIDAEPLLNWLETQRRVLGFSKQFTGSLFWTGADTTYQKVIDYVTDLTRMSEIPIEFEIDETD